MRVEWAKCRGRAHHFTEEVEILSEEISRTLLYKAWDWKEKGKVGDRPSMSAVRAEAHQAYAERQSPWYAFSDAKSLRPALERLTRVYRPDECAD